MKNFLPEDFENSNEKKTMISLRISEEEKRILQKMAKEEDISISLIVRRAIKEYLNKE